MTHRPGTNPMTRDAYVTPAECHADCVEVGPGMVVSVTTEGVGRAECGVCRTVLLTVAGLPVPFPRSGPEYARLLGSAVRHVLEGVHGWTPGDPS